MKGSRERVNEVDHEYISEDFLNRD